MNIVELLKDIDEALSSISEESMDEKIMTKKQAARKRALRAKRRAEKRAEKKAAEQEQQKAQTTEQPIEQSTEQPEQDNAEDKGEKKSFESLIVYDPKMATADNTQTDYSEAFKEFMKHINAIIEKYTPLWTRAEEIWKQQGKDKPCPKEAYDLYQQALNGCQEEFSALVNTTYPQYADKMFLEENEYLEAQFTAVNKFLEEMGKHISSIHPENIEADFKAPSTDVKSTAVTVDAKTATDLVTQDTQNTQVTKTDKEKTDNDPANILTYSDWGKLTHDTSNVWKEINENQKKLNLLKWVDFVKNGFHPLDWFTDRIWSFINSAVVSDFVKTLMYANPLTAMIYDGKLLNFGFKDALTAIHNQCLKQRQERDANKEKSPQNQDKYFYNKRGIPKDLSKCTLNQLNKEFYGHAMFIDWVNLCYHHTEIDPNEQLEVKKMVRLVKIALKEQDREKAVKQFTALCDKINELADILNINTAEEFDSACEQMLGADNVLNRKISAEGRKKVLAQKSKKNQAKKDSAAKTEMEKAIKTLTDANTPRDTIIKTLVDKYNYNKDAVEQYLNDHNYHESYSIVTKLNQLIESALA